jgi:ABC-type glutathione transport system ATPase component
VSVPKIRIDRLAKSFGQEGEKVRALTDFTLTVADGEFVCIVGPSGCGKQLRGTREEAIEGTARPGIRRGELVLREGMGLELEPNACLGMVRVNIGAGVLVTSRGAEELNSLATRVQHVR